MADLEPIREVVMRHPESTTVEDILDICNAEGIEADVWSVYFAGRRAGRKLMRRPREVSGGESHDLALIFLGLHKGMNEALETLDALERMNKAGTRPDWKMETTSAQYGWELSVAQELVDLAGEHIQAREALKSL